MPRRRSRRSASTTAPPRRRADVITDVPGVQAGHWTGAETGVTVVVLPEGTVGSVEIRGGAPATRETAVLDPLATVEQVDAIVLSGGSAFGLAAADGVMQALAEQGRGFPTRGGPVPIVPAAAIFDLVASGGERPGPEEGRAALAAAQDPARAAVRHRPGRCRSRRARRQVARRRPRHHRRAGHGDRTRRRRRRRGDRGRERGRRHRRRRRRHGRRVDGPARRSRASRIRRRSRKAPTRRWWSS